MAAITLTCEGCGRSRSFTEQEMEALVIAFQEGTGERPRCAICGTSLASLLQRALNLSPAVQPPPSQAWTRRRHVRLSLDLSARWRAPDGRGGRGQVTNLSDGGLCLLIQEILPPSTPLRVDLRTRQGVRTFEGEVVWNDAERRSNAPPIAHGIRFAGPVVQGFAVELFLLESTPR